MNYARETRLGTHGERFARRALCSKIVVFLKRCGLWAGEKACSSLYEVHIHYQLITTHTYIYAHTRTHARTPKHVDTHNYAHTCIDLHTDTMTRPH